MFSLQVCLKSQQNQQSSELRGRTGKRPEEPQAVMWEGEDPLNQDERGGEAEERKKKGGTFHHKRFPNGAT